MFDSSLFSDCLKGNACLLYLIDARKQTCRLSTMGGRVEKVLLPPSSPLYKAVGCKACLYVNTLLGSTSLTLQHLLRSANHSASPCSTTHINLNLHPQTHTLHPVSVSSLLLRKQSVCKVAVERVYLPRDHETTSPFFSPSPHSFSWLPYCNYTSGCLATNYDV